jgi:hypothetical protein
MEQLLPHDFTAKALGWSVRCQRYLASRATDRQGALQPVHIIAGRRQRDDLAKPSFG